MGKGKDIKGAQEEEVEEEQEKEYDSDLWTWESYSVSIDVLEPAPKVENPVIPPNPPKAEKTGKKESVEQKEAESDSKPAEPDKAAVSSEFGDESEISASAKSKSQKEKKDPLEGVPTEESIPTRAITRNGKKLTKQDRQALAVEMAKQAAIQAELDAKQAAEEEKIRLIVERKANIEKDKREVGEQKVRIEQLTNSTNVMNSVREQARKRSLEDKEKREWEQFLKCDGLPDPNYCGQMNTYLHRWEKAMEETTMDDAVQKTKEVFQLLEILNLLIDDPSGASEVTIDNWKWVLTLFKKFQQNSLDTATYRLLRDVQRNLNRLNLTTAEFRKKEEHFTFCLFVMVQMPPRMPNPRKQQRPQLVLDFPEMSVNVVFPTRVDCLCMGIRAIYLKYDHLSDLCSTFAAPAVPEEYQSDLCEFTKDDFGIRMYYKYEEYRKVERKDPAVAKKDRLPPIDPKTEAMSIPKVPYIKLEVTASMYALEEAEKLARIVKDRLRVFVEDDVINLRKNVILGGTYYLDLYYQPPQPRDMVTFIMTVTRLERPPFLDEVPFYETYAPPLPTEPNVMLEPEQIEEEMRRVEKALGKLIYVTLSLPKHILWLDTPFICQWDRKRKLWSTADIHDFKFIEEKNIITFRTGRFGCFGIGSPKFTNLPFQAWEIKPEHNGSVTFQITAAILSLEFNIKDNLVCLTDLQNGPTDALQELVGTYYRLPKLIRMLQEGGVEIFPSFDAFGYIEGTCEKQWQMERHLYHCLAQLSICYNFNWSRWNNAAGRRTCVLLMRDYNTQKTRQVPYSTLMVTPFRAVLVNCTEISPEFTTEVSEGMMFYSDLFVLMKAICTMPVRTKVFNAPGHLISTITQLLLATRVLSFSS